MVALASEHVPDVRMGLLPDLPFEDGTFDAAVANFVINHVGDPIAALRGIRRVVRAGGVVAVTIWPSPTPVPQGLAAEAIVAAGVEPVGVARLAAEHEFVRDVDGFAALLSAADLREVTSTELRWDHRADPEVWWSGPARGIGSSGFVLLQQSPETVARVKQEFDRLAAPYLGADGVLTLPAVALLATGRAGQVR
jgi:SAM-dependent methyltransferase